jgi:hypothetical protein
MATTLGVLGLGQIGATAGALVSSNSSEKKFLGQITLTNTSDTTKQEVHLWIQLTATTLTTTKPGGNFIEVLTLQPLQKKTIDLRGHVVDQSYSFSAVADTATTVNYIVSGTTES